MAKSGVWKKVSEGGLTFLMIALALGGTFGIRTTYAYPEVKKATSKVEEKSLQSTPVTGFAELHTHLFADLAFGGAWIHGSVDGLESIVLKSCESTPTFFGHREHHGTTSIPFINDFIGKIAGGVSDTGNHEGRRDGFPTYAAWPRWDTIAHQQAWVGWLKEAHDRGMSLMIMSAVNFEPLCELMPKANRRFDCDDMNAVDRQIEATEELARSHDWLKIVHNSREARETIAEGKLAVLFSIEVSDLFGKMPLREALDKYESKGVRTIQLVHQINNRFAGAALHNPIFRIFQMWDDVRKARSIGDYFHLGFKRNSEGHNEIGLTPEGKSLITEMIRRGWLIDLAHLSEKAVSDVEEISKLHTDYPAYVSHGHFRDMMDDGKFSKWEKSSAAPTLKFVKKTGGLFGLRTGPEKTKKFTGTPVPNDCQGSTKSFAQTYSYGAEEWKLNIATGSDFNGFIQQMRPRFGNSEETCGAERNPEERKRQQAAQKHPLGTGLDKIGLGRINLLPDVIQELKNFGINMSNLESSSEHFIQMWEKAELISQAAKNESSPFAPARSTH